MSIAYTTAFLILKKLFSRSNFYDIDFFSIVGSEPHLDATITSENILRILALMLSYLILDHLYGCTSYLRGLFKEVQDSAFNLTFKLSFIVVFFWMVHNKKLFRRSSVNYWTFSEGPMWSDIFPLCMRMRKMRSCRKLSKYCSILGKNREIFGPHNFWTPIKSNIPDVWNWDFRALFGLEIELQEEGDRGVALPPGHPSGYAPKHRNRKIQKRRNLS